MEQGDEGQGELGHGLGHGQGHGLGHDEQGQRGGLRGLREQHDELGHDGLGHDELEHDVQGHGELGGQEGRGGGHQKLIDAYQCFSCHRGCGVGQCHAEGQLQQRRRQLGGKKPAKRI